MDVHGDGAVVDVRWRRLVCNEGHKSRLHESGFSVVRDSLQDFDVLSAASYNVKHSDTIMLSQGDLQLPAAIFEPSAPHCFFDPSTWHTIPSIH